MLDPEPVLSLFTDYPIEAPNGVVSRPRPSEKQNIFYKSCGSGKSSVDRLACRERARTRARVGVVVLFLFFFEVICLSSTKQIDIKKRRVTVGTPAPAAAAPVAVTAAK